MANYDQFHSTVAELEGGYQNLLSDNGNKNSRGVFVGTKYGISAPVYEQWIGRPPSIQDMQGISKSVARDIFKENYWYRLNANSISSQAVAETFVDHGINAGTGTSARIMQRVLNDKFNAGLRVDGAVGAITLRAINNADPIQLFQEFNAARIAHYKSIGNSDWIEIWKRRVQTIANKFGIELKKKQ